MIRPATVQTRVDLPTSAWLTGAAKGLRKGFKSVEELNLAREAAGCAIRRERLSNYLTPDGAPQDRHQRRIRARAYQIAQTAFHVGDLEPIQFLLEADANKRTAVRQTEPKSGAGTIAHLSTVGGVGQ